MKNIIFDWAGVVRDLTESHLWTINKIFEKYNIPPMSIEELRENWVQPYMLFYEKYIPSFYKDKQDKIYKELMLSDECPRSPAYVGMVELIKKLKEQGKYLVIISSDMKETLMPEIIEYGLEGVFDEIMVDTYDKVEPLLKLIKEKKINPEETCFVGDTLQEIDAGRKANIKTVAVTWGLYAGHRLKTENPDYLVHSVKELEDVLL